MLIQEFNRLYRKATYKDFFEGAHFIEMRPHSRDEVNPIETVVDSHNFLAAARQFDYLIRSGEGYIAVEETKEPEPQPKVKEEPKVVEAKMSQPEIKRVEPPKHIAPPKVAEEKIEIKKEEPTVVKESVKAEVKEKHKPIKDTNDSSNGKKHPKVAKRHIRSIRSSNRKKKKT